MLHAKFHGNQPAGSGEEDFLMVFTIYGHGNHLGHVTRMPSIHFRFPYPMRPHIKKLALIGQAVSEMFEIVNEDDDKRNLGHGYTMTISSPEPR